MTKATNSRAQHDCHFDSLNQSSDTKGDSLGTKLNIEVFTPGQKDADSDKCINMSNRPNARDNAILPTISVTSDGPVNITINQRDGRTHDSSSNFRSSGDNFRNSGDNTRNSNDSSRETQENRIFQRELIQTLRNIEQQLTRMFGFGPQNPERYNQGGSTRDNNAGGWFAGNNSRYLDSSRNNAEGSNRGSRYDAFRNSDDNRSNVGFRFAPGEVFPKLPELSGLPQLPELPALPQLPELPKLPELPGLPGFRGGSSTGGERGRNNSILPGPIAEIADRDPVLGSIGRVLGF